MREAQRIELAKAPLDTRGVTLITRASAAANALQRSTGRDGKIVVIVNKYLVCGTGTVRVRHDVFARRGKESEGNW